MKKYLTIFLGAAMACPLLAQWEDDKVLTPEQIKMTEDAAPKKLAVKPKKVRNILVYTRTEGYRHTEGIPAMNAFLKALEKNSGGMWKLTFTDDPKAFEADNLKKYDCVILNNTTGRFFCQPNLVRQKWTPEQRKAEDEKNITYRDNLIEYVKNGGGVMGAHAACDAMDVKNGKDPDEKFPAYPEMMGGRFAGHPWGAGNSPVTVLVEDTGHPLVKGLWDGNGEFSIQDEIYTFIEEYGFSRDKQRVLLSLDFDRSPKDGGKDPLKETSRKDKDFGLSWLKEYGKGRIFYGAFGHRLDVYWRNPDVCEMYMRGIQFACGDLPADATPLGKDVIAKVQARAAVNAIKSLRKIEFGDNLGPIETTFFRSYKAATESGEVASEIEKLCVAELKAGEGTARYKKILSEMLQVTGANSTAKEVGEIILRDAASSDPKDRYHTESLFISLARSSDPAAKAVLSKLAKAEQDYIRRDAVTALSYFKDPATVAFMADTFAKANSSKDDRMAWTAASALARIGTPEAYARLAEAYKSAKSPSVKNQAGELLLSHAEMNPNAAAAFAQQVYADKSAPRNLRTLAAIQLVRAGKSVDDTVLLEDVIRYLGRNKDVKIPASMELAKLPEYLQAEMVYALTNRGEGYEQIAALAPTTAGTAKAVTYAVARFGSDKDLEKVASFAELYDGGDMRSAAFDIASIKSTDKLRKLTELSGKLQGKPRELIVEAMANLDASASVDYLFGVVTGSGSDADKLAALKTLENAVVKNSEVFVRAAALLPKAPDSLRRGVMGLMVACSRRDCDASMVAAAKKLFDAAKTPAEKAQFLRFASANAAEDGVNLCLEAYRQGMKSQALAELSKWNNASALAPMMALDQSLKAPADRKAVQTAMISVITKAGAIEHEASDYIVNNAVDKKDSRLVSKMKRLNLAKFELQKLPGGITGTAFKSAGELKNAFDGNRGSRWSTGEDRKPGQWIQFEIPNVRTLCAIELDLGNSKGDGIKSPKLYVGESMEDFDEVEITLEKSENGDLLKFKAPKKAKLIRIENGGSSGGWWSVHEINLVDDPSTFKNLQKMPGGFVAGSNRNANGLKNAFDGNIDSRWSTEGSREPGQWFMFGFDKPKTVNAVVLKLGSSSGDRVLNPKVYAGETVEKMVPVKVKYSQEKREDVITFEPAVKAKYIRIENTRESGGFWSIHEVEVK